jgi:hypothetical protein
MAPITKIKAEPTLIIFPPVRSSTKSVCVLGVPRGGTSMIAGILRLLGVFIGERVDNANNEDQDFLGHNGDRTLFSDGSRLAERKKYFAFVRRTVLDRQKYHQLWAWKDPKASFYIEHILNDLVSPFFILVTRDPAAIMQREMMETPHPARIAALITIDGVLEQYRSIMRIIGTARHPTILVSYERSLRNAQRTIQEIAEFLGLGLPEIGLLKEISKYVQPDRLDGNPEAVAGVGEGVFASAQLEAAKIRSSVIVPNLKAADIEACGIDECIRLEYMSAAQRVNKGECDEVDKSIYGILNYISRFEPIISDGPQGVIAECAFGSPGRFDNDWMDTVVGCLFMLGMIRFRSQANDVAQLYFAAGARLARLRLQRHFDASPISRDLVCPLIFHEAFAAAARGAYEPASAAERLFTAACHGKIRELSRDELSGSVEKYLERTRRELGPF